MAGESLGANFSIDITRLRAGLKEANQLIRESQSTFKAAAAGMDDWTKSEEGLTAKINSLTKTADVQREKVKALKDNYERLISDGMKPTSNEASKLRTEIKNEEAALAKTEKEIKNNTDALDELKKETDNTNSTVGKLERTIASQEKELNELGKEYAETALSMGKNSKEAKELKSEYDSLEKELNDNKNKLDEVTLSLDKSKDAADKASGGFSVMKGALADLVADGISLCINALKEFITESIEVGKTFDSSMSQVGAVSGATAEELDRLRDKAKEMGSTTKFTASEAADAFNYMAMAGWKTEEMIGGIDGILNLAAASGSDLATTSDIVTDALTAMGYSAKDAGHLADVMAAASSNANTNVELMGMTFQYAAPIVGALGYNMEDTAVAIGLMANAGIKGEKSGTALRSILTRLSAPPKEAAEAMAELGISITDSNGKMKSLDTVMGDLRNAFSGLSETEQTAAAKHIAGAEAMSGLLAIVNAAPADFEKLTKAVEDSDGAAKEMSETMLDNLGGDMTLLQSKLEGVQLTLYEKFEPALRDGVDALSGLLDAVNWVIDHSDGFIAALTAMAAGIAIYVAYTTALKVMKDGWMALEIVQKAVAASQAVLNAVMAANPIGLVIAAIAALVAAFVVLWNKSETFREFWIHLWEKVKETLHNAVTKIKEWIDSAKEKFGEFKNKVVENFTSMKEKVVSIFKKMKDAIKTPINGIIGFINSLMSGVTSGINTVIRALNRLSITIPDWVPEFGGKSFGFNISELTAPQIPLLAKGGVVRSATTAVIGENGAEAVVPLERNTEWIKRLAKEISNEQTQKSVIVNQTNNYSQAHSRYEIYKSKQQTEAAVRLAMAGA